MIYEIETKTDLSGAMLIIRFPEEDLDKKALYTIENEQPGFLVPFSYRSVDGMVECTYRLGSLMKLQYHFGIREPAAYVEFWSQVLQPLLDCDDWFLKPFSFVLDIRYLYTDKQDSAVRYLYVPSLKDCEKFDALQAMAMKLSQENSVMDPALENKVLRAMMQNFQPRSFLEMLRSVKPAVKVVREEAPAEKKFDLHLPESLLPRKETASEAPEVPQVPQAPVEVRKPAEPVPSSAPAADDGDIHIDFGGGKKEKPAKEHKSLFGGKKEKPAKEHKSLFGGKKEKAPRQVILGAAAEPAPAAVPQPQPRPSFGVRQEPAQPAVSYDSDTADGATELMEEDACSCCLRLVGDPGMPREIPVNIEPGCVFTIGRFDVSVGHQQSDFEFEKHTKAVSRRHAAIERSENGEYSIVDLASSAGTFVDGMRLTPNVPQTISGGNRISFGTGGADYIWNA